MKRIIAIMVVALCCTVAVRSQNEDVKIQQLKERIAARDTIIGQVKQKFKADTLQLQVNDYKQLVSLIEVEAKKTQSQSEILMEELKIFKLLTTDDAPIFSKEIIDAIKKRGVPVCLITHFNLISQIVELRTKIEDVEATAQKLSEQLKDFDETKANSLIGEKIEPKVSLIDSMITNIKKLDMSTLSETQRKYFFQKLIGRYNNFSKYYE